MLQLIQSNLSNYLLFYHKKGFKIITAKDYGKIYHLGIFILNVLQEAFYQFMYQNHVLTKTTYLPVSCDL